MVWSEQSVHVNYIFIPFFSHFACDLSPPKLWVFEGMGHGFGSLFDPQDLVHTFQMAGTQLVLIEQVEEWMNLCKVCQELSEENSRNWACHLGLWHGLNQCHVVPLKCPILCPQIQPSQIISNKLLLNGSFLKCKGRGNIFTTPKVWCMLDKLPHAKNL